MIVRFRRGNMTETRPVHGKLDHHVSAGRKRDGYKQLPVSVEFPKYGVRTYVLLTDGHDALLNLHDQNIISCVFLKRNQSNDTTTR